MEQEKAAQAATTSLILGIVGLVCCPICAIPAWIMGQAELKRINAGESPAAGKTLAQVGMILGIIGCVFLILQLLWVFAFGGLAVISAMSGGGS